MLSTLGVIFNRQHCEIVVLIFFLCFCGDNLHEILNPELWKYKKNINNSDSGKG